MTDPNTWYNLFQPQGGPPPILPNFTPPTNPGGAYHEVASASPTNPIASVGGQNGPTPNNNDNTLKLILDFAKEIHGRHLGIGGGEITPQNPTGDPRDPFNSGFFQSAQDRLAAMTNHTGAYNAPNVIRSTETPTAPTLDYPAFLNRPLTRGLESSRWKPKDRNDVDWNALFTQG